MYQLGPANHMTHIDNLNGILTKGGLLPYNKMAHGSYTDLANEDVQKGRARVVIPQSNRPLHDYVPLYFGFKTSMVFKNKNLNDGMIFLRFSLDILGMPGVVFSDGNARTSTTQFYKLQSLEDLKTLNANAISKVCLLYTSPSPRDGLLSRMPSSA